MQDTRRTTCHENNVVVYKLQHLLWVSCVYVFAKHFHFCWLCCFMQTKHFHCLLASWTQISQLWRVWNHNARNLGSSVSTSILDTNANHFHIHAYRNQNQLCSPAIATFSRKDSHIILCHYPDNCACHTSVRIGYTALLWGEFSPSMVMKIGMHGACARDVFTPCSYCFQL